MRGKEIASTPSPSHGLPEDAIRRQLERILTSDEFQVTDRIRAFLRFIVEETLAGRADQLKGYTIAMAVFDRGEDFDAAQDPIVRIQAGRLRRALERYYLVAGGTDPIVIDVPKGRYVPHFVRRAARVEAAGASPAPDATPEPAVAVLPLENLTGDPEKLYFTLGLTEELVTELNRYHDLTVIPCHRAAAGTASPPDLEQFCRSFGARFMLAGSVRSDAETVKFSVQLVDATTGRQVWARAYKRGLEAASLIRTQEEVAHDVVAAVASEHGIIARRLTAESSTKSPAELSTYEAMLRYYGYQIDPSPAASVPCFAALREAAEREPDYGPVWSALASLYCQMHIFDAPGFDAPLATGLVYAKRGVTLDRDRQMSHLVLAYAHLLDEDRDAFAAEAEATLALNPTNPYAVGAIGFMKVLAGDYEQGRQLLDRATAAGPFHPHWFEHGIYLDHYRRGEYEAALEALRRNEGSGFWPQAMMAAALGKLGRAREAAPHVASLLEQKPDFPSRARELLARSAKVPQLVDELLDGLKRARVIDVDENS